MRDPRATTPPPWAENPMAVQWRAPPCAASCFAAMSTPDPLEVFQEAVGQVSAGDLDAVMEYYEPDAVFVDPTGVTIQGRDAIRAVMGEYLGLKPTLTVNKVRKLIETP